LAGLSLLFVIIAWRCAPLCDFIGCLLILTQLYEGEADDRSGDMAGDAPAKGP
jgi:hypothetical protein